MCTLASTRFPADESVSYQQVIFVFEIDHCLVGSGSYKMNRIQFSPFQASTVLCCQALFAPTTFDKSICAFHLQVTMHLIATIVAAIVLFAGFQAGVIMMISHQLLEPDWPEIDVESDLEFDNSDLAQDHTCELNQVTVKDSFGSFR